MMAAPFGRNTGDPQGNALMLRGREAWQQGQDARIQDYYHGGSVVGAPPPITNVIPDSRWSGLLQALAEQGATKLRTGAAAKMGARGFFDLQDPQSLQRQQLLEHLRAQDLNRGVA